jgi:biotin-(acetyl-CoA carboxylase) ligase
MAARAPVDRLVVDLIRRHLATEMVGRHLYLFDGVPSTNAALRTLALSGAEEGTVVLAEGQSAGRGRLGAAAFLNFLEKWLGVYRVDGRHAILAAWRSRDALSGREVEVRGEGAPYRGRAAGVEPDGPLVVVDASGVRHRVLTGEVRLAGDADSA